MSDNTPRRGQEVLIGPGCATAGHYRIESTGTAGSVAFQSVLKPSFIKRMIVKFLLGWEWKDDPKPGTGIEYATINMDEHYYKPGRGHCAGY